MHCMKRLIALCLVLLVLMMNAAHAEVPFLMHSADWNLDEVPVEVLLKAQVETHMPFDDDRLAMLTPITDIISLRLVTGDEEGLVTINVAEQEALTLQYKGTALRLSCRPEVTYKAEGDPMSALLGEEVSVAGGYEAFHLAPASESLITDGEAMLANIPSALEKYGKRYASDTNISGYGKSAYRIDFNFAAGKEKSLKEGLLNACPDGWLKEIISAMTFSGKQALRVYYDKNDHPLRVEYNGSFGPEGNNRTVKLVCRIRHDAEMDKLYIELTTPAKKGKNKNDLTFERTITTNKKGARTIVGSFKYTASKDGTTSVWNGEFNLSNAYKDEADVLGGDFTIQTKLNGAEKYSAITVAPELTISGSEEAPVITGWLNVTEQYAGKVTEQAKISIDLKRAEPLEWTDTERIVDLSAMTEAAKAAVREDTTAMIATALVVPLINALGENATYFFRDLPEEAVKNIMDAAASYAQ